jgi:hypothetical protein
MIAFKRELGRKKNKRKKKEDRERIFFLTK